LYQVKSDGKMIMKGE